MHASEWLSCSESILARQVAKRVFEKWPEDGPVAIIMDTNDNCWVSAPEKLSDLAISKAVLKQIAITIDDGAEPVLTQVDNWSIVASQLAAGRTNYGYVLIAFDKSAPESALVNADLIEALIGQINLIAELLEHNTCLSQLQRTQLSSYRQVELASN